MIWARVLTPMEIATVASSCECPRQSLVVEFTANRFSLSDPTAITASQGDCRTLP